MNKRQKQVQRSLLKDEIAVIKELEKSYEKALKDINGVIARLLARKDTENLQSIIYQVKYQTALKKEIESFLEVLHTNNYTLIDDYLKDCYKNAHAGVLYNMRSEGIPFIVPLEQEQMVSAITLNSKLSQPLYNALGYNIDHLKVNVASEISRGIAQALSYERIALNLKNVTNVDYNKTLRIAITEGHRIQNESAYNVMVKAKEKGANVVKQWDSTLDGKTRPTHRELDGTIVEVDEYFVTSNGDKALYCGEFGNPKEDIRCRCCVLEISRYDIDEGFTKWDGFTDTLRNFTTPKDYNEFKKWYWSKENLDYMNFYNKMEQKYDTKNFKKLLNNMSDEDYKMFKKLEENSPLWK